MKTRLMYIENKSGENDLIGDARIGRVAAGNWRLANTLAVYNDIEIIE